MREATELESTVLGVVWLRGPCTAYVVRQEFLSSTSSHWSGSAGSIYPLLRRLEEAGLIRSREHNWGRGAKKEFSITPKGLKSLQAWVGPALPEWTAAPTFDPVRTRLSFLGVLPPKERKHFLQQAQRNLDAEIARAREAIEEFDREGDPYEHLVFLGTLYELEGRRKWLGDVTKRLAAAPRKSRKRASGG